MLLYDFFGCAGCFVLVWFCWLIVALLRLICGVLLYIVVDSGLWLVCGGVFLLVLFGSVDCFLGL